MKIIEFKGKLKASQEWAYGNLCKRIDGGYIVTPDETPIGKYGAIQEGTESQYTGINDIEENKIYENDILEMTEEGRILFGSDNHPCSKYQLGYSNIDIYLAASQLSELLRNNIINLNIKSDLNEDELKKVKYLYKLLKVDDLDA